MQNPERKRTPRLGGVLPLLHAEKASTPSSRPVRAAALYFHGSTPSSKTGIRDPNGGECTPMDGLGQPK
jgi:hypothetical protein